MKPRTKSRATSSSTAVASKSAFVVMPIGQEGTENHQHFYAIYNEHIRPAVEACGFKCKRASDDAAAGVITRDMIVDIVHSDLVVVDVTLLNPNVLYELGIRHGTTKSGTILICDKGKTPTPPFDINSCRVLYYESVAHKLGQLRGLLERSIQQTVEQGETDSQVFLWTEISERTKAVALSTAYADNLADGTPLETLEQARTEADQSRMPSQLLERAQIAVRDEEVKDFVSVCIEFLSLEVLRPTVRDFRQLNYLARRLTSRGGVTRALLAAAHERFPDNREINDLILVERLRSDQRVERDAARTIIFERLSIQQDRGKISFPENIDSESYEGLLPMVLDAMHDDGENFQALAITKAMIERTPGSTIALRNHARAIEKTPNESHAAMGYFRKAISAEDVDDTSAVWFSGSLSRANRNIEALEVNAFAMLLDLDEAKTYSAFATLLSDITSPRNVLRDKTTDGRVLPSELLPDYVVSAVAMAESCPNFGVDSRLMCEAALDNAGFTVDDVQRYIDDNGDQTRRMRHAWANQIYSLLATDLTKRSN